MEREERHILRRRRLFFVKICLHPEPDAMLECSMCNFLCACGLNWGHFPLHIRQREYIPLTKSMLPLAAVVV